MSISWIIAILAVLILIACGVISAIIGSKDKNKTDRNALYAAAGMNGVVIILVIVLAVTNLFSII